MRLLAAFSLSFLLALPTAALAEDPAPLIAASAPESAVHPSHPRRTYDAIHERWWAPALISLGATAAFDGLGAALANADSDSANTFGAISLYFGTGASSYGWAFLIDNQTSAPALALIGVSGIGRIGELSVSWGVALAQDVRGFHVCFTGQDCSALDAKQRADHAQAAHTFWVSTDVAIGLSAADITAQLIYGYVNRDHLAAPIAQIVPAMLPTGDNKLAPGLAWSGQF